MSELLPCPICGGDAIIQTVCGDEHFIKCCRCGLSTDTVIDDFDPAKKILTERWNRRSPSPVVNVPALGRYKYALEERGAMKREEQWLI